MKAKAPTRGAEATATGRDCTPARRHRAAMRRMAWHLRLLEKHRHWWAVAQDEHRRAS
jgi:hypothetical protein